MTLKNKCGKIVFSLVLLVVFAITLTGQAETREEWELKYDPFKKPIIELLDGIIKNRKPIKYEKKQIDLGQLDMKARELYTRAEKGIDKDQYTVAKNFCNGINGFPRNLQHAVYWYYRSAEQGNYMARSSLAEKLVSGEGMEKNIPEAMYWYAQSALNDFTCDKIALGDLYYLGNDCEQNYENAVLFYVSCLGSRSISIDNLAKINLRMGVCFMEGKGCNLRRDEAIRHFMEVITEKSNRDITCFGEYKALAMYCLGRCYYEGIDCVRNTILARQYLRKAKKIIPDMNCFYARRMLKDGTWEKELLKKMLPYADKILKEDF